MRVIYREFIVPDDEEVLEVIGEWPEEAEEGVRSITCHGDKGDTLVVSYGSLQRSVRVRWSLRGGEELLSLFREGATRMTVSSGEGGKCIHIEFRVGELAGGLEIQISPIVTIRDQLFFA